MKPRDIFLYNIAREIVYQRYEKPSAYRSGALVKLYKQLFKNEYGDIEPYIGDNDKPLKRWFKEEWKDVANLDYPVYRPTKRINKKTPLTVSEIDPTNLMEQSVLKQTIKGKKNLPPFKPK